MTTDAPAPEREILTYDLFGAAVQDLAQQVVDDGFEPDIVLAIARGGLGLAMGLGYALDVKNLAPHRGLDRLPVVLDAAADRRPGVIRD